MKEYFRKNRGNQLIHFAKSLENVISILDSEHLRLNYCKEEFGTNYSKTISKNVHPMVCFSEQNILQLKDQKISYGKYGIAFNPTWIIENNIQPVMYVEQNSPIAQALAHLLTYRRKLKKGHHLRLPIMTIKCFVKNTIGYNSYFDISNFLFKEENEWRFVHSKKQIGDGYISENRSTFEKDPESYNNRLVNYPLNFKRDRDVLCVYCENEWDKPIIMDKFSISDKIIQLANWK